MSDALPLALAIAASPFAILPAVLLLTAPRARTASPAFLGGWLAGIAAAVSVGAALTDLIDSSGAPRAWTAWARLVIGLALVVLGVRRWARRTDVSEPPAWLTSFRSAGPATAGRMALALSVLNPKVVLLALAGGLSIATATDDLTTTVLAIAVFALAASTTVGLPIVAFFVLGDRIRPPLEKGADWLERHSGAVVSIVAIGLGVMLIVRGLSSLIG